jgi:4-hydroxybenzoate polyprenyltransferase
MPSPNPKPLALRLWRYQAERFPLVALVPTTLAVLYSTWAVLSEQGIEAPLVKYAALGVAGLSFLLHTRITDELRDRTVDDVHHPDRPLQRGLVSAAELTRVGFANGGIFITLHALLDPLSGLLSAGLLAYSLIARYEVGPLKWLKPRFYLYNVVMLAQMLLLQWIAYAARHEHLGPQRPNRDCAQVLSPRTGNELPRQLLVAPRNLGKCPSHRGRHGPRGGNYVPGRDRTKPRSGRAGDVCGCLRRPSLRAQAQ